MLKVTPCSITPFTDKLEPIFLKIKTKTSHPLFFPQGNDLPQEDNTICFAGVNHPALS